MGGRSPRPQPKPGDVLPLVGPDDPGSSTTAETRLPGTTAGHHARTLMLVLVPLMVAELVRGVGGPSFSVLPLYALSVAFAARSGGLVAGLLTTGACGVLSLIGGAAAGALPAWNTIAGLLALVLIARVAAGAARMASELRASRRLAAEDPLTEVLNSRGLELCLPREMARCVRLAAPLSVVFLDLDEFKTVNDRFGHARGDHVLRSIAASIRAALRTEDVLARVGGDEFVVLLPCTGAAEAAVATERLRVAISTAMNPDGWRITASLGVVTWHQPRGAPEAVIKRADEAMYAAKRSGGDCVCHLSVATNCVATLAEADRLLRAMTRAHEARSGARS